MTDLNYKQTVQRRIAPMTVESRIPGRTLADFGKEAFGFLELLPPKGARGAYEVRLGELLRPDGSVDLEPGATIRAARVAGTIDADGVVRVPLEPDPRNTTGGREGGAIPVPQRHGVVMPFRYVEVLQAPFRITKETIRMVAVNYPIDLSESSFRCDDDRLNRVYDLCKHTILVSSFAGLYVDGDRERIPYEADAYINQLSDYAVHSDYALARASHVYLMKHPTWPTEWKQHSIFMAWADWMWSGDATALEEFYDTLRNEKLLERFRRESDGLLVTGGERNPGATVNDRGAADIVDWPVGERDGFVFTDVNAVVNAFYHLNLLQVAEFARALGKMADARLFRRRARAVRKAYNAAFFDAKRGVYRDGIGTDHASLHANAAALAFGLVLKKNTKRVASYCASKGMACSVYFAQYLLEGLFRAGKADAALALMTASGDRGWLGMMGQGATTTMEAWSVKYKPNLDLCHAWGTAPLNVISRFVLGVTPLEPGFAKIRVAPQVGSLRHVEAKVPTAKGPVSISVEGKMLTLDTPAPALVEWNGSTYDMPAGRHTFPEILVFNEDNSAFGSCRKYGGPLTEKGLRDYVRRISAGGRVTHFFMCPNGMCANWDSAVMEPIWAAFDRPGAQPVDWQSGLRSLHDAGLDLYAIWADEARKRGVSPWLSIRMNDAHCVDNPDNGMHSAFWRDHPEFRRVPGSKGAPWTDAALDFSHEEVRAYWKAFLAEAFGRYDIDGVELDWMRFPEHLPPGRGPEFSWCLDEIMAEARRIADSAAKRLGHNVRVGARVSSRPEKARARGTDFETWARRGWIDWLVPTNFWWSVDFNLPYAEWTRLLAPANPKTLVVPGLDGGAAVDGKRHFLSLGEYSVFADRMYRQGAPGVYLFNLFDSPKESGVWDAILSEGLPPSLVRARANGIAVTDVHD